MVWVKVVAGNLVWVNVTTYLKLDSLGCLWQQLTTWQLYLR